MFIKIVDEKLLSIEVDYKDRIARFTMMCDDTRDGMFHEFHIPFKLLEVLCRSVLTFSERNRF